MRDTLIWASQAYILRALVPLRLSYAIALALYRQNSHWRGTCHVEEGSLRWRRPGDLQSRTGIDSDSLEVFLERILRYAYPPEYRCHLSGSFDGTDLNSNGVIDRSELTSLTLQGRDVLSCVSSPPVTCGVSEFSFIPGGAFALRGNYVDYWDDNGGPNWTWNEISMDTTAGFYSMIARAQQFYEGRDWMFIPETQFTISAVPEPETYLMLLAGMFAIGAATGSRSQTR